MGFDPAVSSPEYYLTPAPNADLIRGPLLVGRHLIILNKSGHATALYLSNSINANRIFSVVVVPLIEQFISTEETCLF